MKKIKMNKKIISPSIKDLYLDLDSFTKSLKYCGFGARRLAEATDIFYEMVTDKKITKFLGLAGAMVPAGMRSIISDMIKENYIDVIVTTGANMVHDIIESIGLHHYIGNDNVNDNELFEKKIDRIYDVYLPDSNFEQLEKFIQNSISSLNTDNPIKIKDFLDHLGEKINDNNSILKTAHDMNVPIYCPAFPDSIIGLQSYLYKEVNKLVIDCIGDMHDFINLCWESEKSGAILIGGGVPKNYIFQSMLVTPKEFDYAIQLTMDSPQTGGLSGATLNEAISWGKINKSAKFVTVYSDATITLPLIVGSVKSRIVKRESIKYS